MEAPGVSTKSGSQKSANTSVAKSCKKREHKEGLLEAGSGRIASQERDDILLIKQPIIPHARSDNGLRLQCEFPHARIHDRWPFGGRSSYGITQTASYFSS